MTNDTNTVGFFGKLPSLGDFVTRRLPRSFTDPWDSWLQSCLRGSQECLAEQWLSLFLVSPFWRFALSPGLCGASAWAGVMMPSVDRVGRYYPLTLAQAVDSAQLAQIFLPESPWFARLENAALTVLDEPFDLDSFEQSLLAIHLPSRTAIRCLDLSANDSSLGRNLLHCQLESLRHSGSFFAGLSQVMLDRIGNGYSFWATEGGYQGDAQLLCCQGMPTVDAYVGFLQSAGQTSAESNPYPVMRNDEPTTLPGQQTSVDFSLHRGWQSHGISVVGKRRKHNEDAMLNAPELGLWVVADGMGGHQAGDVASQRIVAGLSLMPRESGLNQCRDWLFRRLQQINDDLYRFAGELHPGAVIGSTVVALLAEAEQCLAVWAGDSRLYRLRGDQFKQITQDHTLLEELVALGGMKREEALQQVGANVITRAVGGQENLELDCLGFTAQAGDRYLLCSDGLDKELSESEIAQRLAGGDCRQAADGLIETALGRNAIDNITVVVIDFFG